MEVMKMTKYKLTKPFRSIKSFLLNSKRKSYFAMLEKAYSEQAIELQRLKLMIRHR